MEPVAGGCRLRHRGADLKVAVLTPRHAELAALMPEKAPPDTSKLLLCPMPGLVVRIDVGEGDEVYDGQALCMVEAMKMENVLRAERKARVAGCQPRQPRGRRRDHGVRVRPARPGLAADGSIARGRVGVMNSMSQ